METYNGWKNRATWNVALWIENDYGLYCTARSYVQNAKRDGMRVSYGKFLDYAGLRNARTPDGFKYDGKQLDRKALREMLEEMLD